VDLVDIPARPEAPDPDRSSVARLVPGLGVAVENCKPAANAEASAGPRSVGPEVRVVGFGGVLSPTDW